MQTWKQADNFATCFLEIKPALEVSLHAVCLPPPPPPPPPPAPTLIIFRYSQFHLLWLGSAFVSYGYTWMYLSTDFLISTLRSFQTECFVGWLSCTSFTHTKFTTCRLIDTLVCCFDKRSAQNRVGKISVVTTLRPSSSGVRVPARERDFCVLRNVHSGSEARPASLARFFPGV